MLGSIHGAKQALRQQARAWLKNLSAAERAAQSAQACALLEQQARWRQAHAVLFYAPLSEELDVWPLLLTAARQDKTVALPRFLPATHRYVPCRVRDLAGDLRRGRFGIREPVEACEQIPLNALDLILVPGLAFDLHGRRLGRGRGFYDQVLALVRGTACGVAFDQQIVPEVPAGPRDIRVNCILTPTRWIEQ